MRTRFSNLYLESSTSFYGTGPVHTGLESLFLLGLTSAGFSGTALAVGVSVLSGVASIGLSLGLSYLASSIFAPKAPKPEDVQQSVKQPSQPRVRHYGRVKVSGPWAFAEAYQGNFFKLLAIGQGPIDAIEEFWVGDKQVTLGVGSAVQQDPWWDGGKQKLKIYTRYGEATETHYSELSSVFPQWTSAHRGDGVASLLAFQAPVGSETYMQMFPEGVNTNYRVVIRGSKLKNPTTGTVGWDDSAASVIRDYITHSDGMRLPESIVSTPLAQAGWVAAYNRAAEAVATKEGSEPRYRLWGSYSLEERPADVLGRMMASCDGRLVPTSDGGLTLDIGKWAEPTVTIGPETITGFSEVGRGRDILSTANTIRATYLDPNQDYQGADADPWVDAVDVSERGEIASDMQFMMSPSHSQARRLMKLAAFRANPSWVGQFQCNLRALAAFDQRFVRLQFPAFGINTVVEVMDFRFNIGEGGILQGVTIQVQSMPSTAYAWDAAQEEGDAPVYDESDVDNTVPVPDAPTVDILVGPKARLSFSPPPSAILAIEAQYKLTAVSDWAAIAVASDATTVDSPNLVAGEDYEFQLRYVTEKGRPGEWSASTVKTATAP